MTRNQKIALGCGGAGCLGLIVIAVAGGLIYFFAYRPVADRVANYNYNYNYNYNRNANLNSNTNDNSDDSANSSSSNSSSSSSSSTSSAELSEDEKHRLFQAAATTGDQELQRRVWVKIGILNEDFTQGDKFAEFAGEHIRWVFRNYQWIAEINTPEKARAYIDEHLPN